ncbi:thiamine-phosphate kinase [Desulfonispora thiosulfatigenes DSM 11270]|uniref:Thiamine-monophosphate kinase n=1 Tax=Desulfonispora thiosulfatigenes DSM 11270 TaxID=656914 RepID=A0A1W1VMV6_DESTI|nr:thiamine-phosphate kinase [Desulfonispora thiosulfatigenes]SMB94656.1 thiamine-phosphate kinase [Desulfonispora thiosulfatigenes DSM 11270]
MNLKDIGEFGFIKRVTKDSIFNPSEIIVGIGDDCAVLPLDEKNYLLASCDMLIENVHFLKNKSTPYQIGYKSVAVNFSDIAAMGGYPTGVMISIGFPKENSLEEIEQVYQGISDICKKYNANIVGGDTVSTKDGLVINVSVFGKVKKEHLHLRSEAKIDDIVFTTGNLGDSAAGLEIVLNNDLLLEEQSKEKLLLKHYQPEPCLKEVELLNQARGLHALNDISDGLASEAREIAEASNVGIEIYEDKIPLSNEAKELALITKKNPLEWALYGGEDFQLVGTIHKDDFEKLNTTYEKVFNRSLYNIGKVTKEKGVFLIKDNQRTQLKAGGYNHFA